jgi:osmotically-inducible protein OsmY
MRSKKSLLVAVGLGAVTAYYLDRDRGHARRVHASDRARAAMRRRRNQAASQARYMDGQAEGEAAIRTGAGRFHPTDNHAIAEHLRTVLARLDVDTRHVNVEVVDGLVRLRGQVSDEDAAAHILRAVEHEPGVKQTESLLHLPGQPAPNKTAALQAEVASR